MIGIGTLLMATTALAQSGEDRRPRAARYAQLPDQSLDDARTMSLRDSLAVYLMFRSVSTLSGGANLLFLPSVTFTHNSALPYSLNDGAMWAGRGSNARVIAGAQGTWSHFRLAVLPELLWSANDEYDITVPTNFAPRPDSRNAWSSPFHTQSQSIDLPIRFGDRPITRLQPGQSSALADAKGVEFGISTENEWWGPGMRNALLLSTNAPGFPRLLVRTANPVSTRIGTVEATWQAGGLSESGFFDNRDDNDLRRIALLGISLRPRNVNGLTVGAARAVFSPASGWPDAFTGFLDVFRDTGDPNALPLSDTTHSPGPDQLFSLFGKWTFPSSGFEAYVEWGRATLPRSLRDALEQPNHTQAYTLGLQWLGDEWSVTHGRLRVQGEATFVQQSTTYRFRPIGSWYASSPVPQGYTNQGQVLGAAIGPGSSSQWLAVDHVAGQWTGGLYMTRVRWLEDSRSQVFPPIPLGNGWCEHDVSLLGGVRGSLARKTGTVTADFSTGWRYDVFFNHLRNSCPFARGRDERNKSLTLTVRPSALTW